jgi:GDPmannose 4,6-dehydratase
MPKKALITGITGQDGAYLAKLLLSKGYKVIGGYRRVSTPNYWRLIDMGIYRDIEMVPLDLMDQGTLFQVVNHYQPEEIYHLAAQSYVGVSFDMPLITGEIDGLGTVRLLDAARQVSRHSKIYIASTSELYGFSISKKGYQDENTPMLPRSPYAAGKLYSYHIAKQYREGYGMFVANGILFNHESPYRGLEFVTRRISNGVARISVGKSESLILGNIDSMRDWGYAGDYVEAMYLILQQESPQDFVIATGETHTVKDFVDIAFQIAGLDKERYFKTDVDRYRQLDVPILRGDASKALKTLGWKPKVDFINLVKLMVETDMLRWNRSLSGETFPWDVPISDW